MKFIDVGDPDAVEEYISRLDTVDVEVTEDDIIRMSRRSNFTTLLKTLSELERAAERVSLINTLGLLSAVQVDILQQQADKRIKEQHIKIFNSIYKLVRAHQLSGRDPKKENLPTELQTTYFDGEVEIERDLDVELKSMVEILTNLEIVNNDKI